jgi:hypothetical protein
MVQSTVRVVGVLAEQVRTRSNRCNHVSNFWIEVKKNSDFASHVVVQQCERQVLSIRTPIENAINKTKTKLIDALDPHPHPQSCLGSSEQNENVSKRPYVISMTSH